MVPGGISNEATEIYQEGVRIPAIKLFSQGQPIASVMRIIEVNSRLPDTLRGDLWAGVAAVRVGAKRLEDLSTKYGVETFQEAMRHFMDYGEQVSLRALQGLPKGTFELSEEQDSGVTYHVKVDITDQRFTVDLRHNPDQDRASSNTCFDGSMISVQMIFKNLTDPLGVCKFVT